MYLYILRYMHDICLSHSILIKCTLCILCSILICVQPISQQTYKHLLNYLHYLHSLSHTGTYNYPYNSHIGVQKIHHIYHNPARAVDRHRCTCYSNLFHNCHMNHSSPRSNNQRRETCHMKYNPRYIDRSQSAQDHHCSHATHHHISV